MTLIRPPDPLVRTPTLAYMPISSDNAVRRILHLAFRDCWDVLDLTYGNGGFWSTPLPPGLAVTTNNPLPISGAVMHRDFTDTGLDDGAFALAVFDPPHIADGGKAGIMAHRYGTVKGTDGLRTLIMAGVWEARRIARTGLIVKVADHAHGGEMLPMTQWVLDSLPTVQPYLILHTYRWKSLVDRKWKVQRAPRCNGATYLAFRFDSRRHKDWDRLYARQERDATGGLKTEKGTGVPLSL